MSGVGVEGKFLRDACLYYGSWWPSQLEKARAALPAVGAASIHAAAAAGDVAAVRRFLDGHPALVRAPGEPYR